MRNAESSRLPQAILFLFIAWIAAGGATIGLAQSPALESYRIDCSKPKEASESAVCEQGKANSISEKALKVSEQQVYLSVIGFAGLLITILLSIIGTIFAFFAVRASQSQTRILRNSLIQERRAWIKVELESRGALEEKGDYASVAIAAKITNLGASPAFNVHTNVKFVEFDNFNDIYNIVIDYAKECEGTNVTDGRVVLPSDFYFRPWAPGYTKSNKGYSNRILLICVSYRILNSDTIHQTVAPYMLSSWDVEHGNATLSEPHFAHFTAWGAGLAS